MIKTIKYYLLFLVLQLVVYGCCEETVSSTINDIYFANSDIQTDVDDNVIVNQEDFRLRLNFDNKQITTFLDKSSFTNSAYAMSCDSKFEGLRSDIISMTITCNKEILETAAGMPIDYSKLRAYPVYFAGDEGEESISVDEMIQQLNDGGILDSDKWLFKFQEAIISTEFLKFKIEIKQEDGSTFVKETNSVKIQ